MSQDPNCIFCKIIAGQIPSRKVYEDDEILAFHDIHPWAPVHFLMVPKLHIPSMAQLTRAHERLMGRIMLLAPRLALEQGCRPYPEGGFRIVATGGTARAAHASGTIFSITPPGASCSAAMPP